MISKWCLATPYTPNLTATFENCQKHEAGSPLCRPCMPSVLLIVYRAWKTPRYGLFPLFSSPWSCIRVFTTSMGLVKQIAPTAAVPPRTNSLHGLRCAAMGIPCCREGTRSRVPPVPTDPYGNPLQARARPALRPRRCVLGPQASPSPPLRLGRAPGSNEPGGPRRRKQFQ